MTGGVIKLVGLFVLAAALGTWILFAGSVLEGVGSGGSLLATASPTAVVVAEPSASPTAVPPTATASPTRTPTAAPPTPTAAVVQPTAAPPVEPRPASYTVVAGDNLTRIANRFGTTVEALQRANGLSNTMIRIGQVLVIPPR